MRQRVCWRSTEPKLRNLSARRQVMSSWEEMQEHPNLARYGRIPGFFYFPPCCPWAAGQLLTLHCMFLLSSMCIWPMIFCFSHHHDKKAVEIWTCNKGALWICTSYSSNDWKIDKGNVILQAARASVAQLDSAPTQCNDPGVSDQWGLWDHVIMLASSTAINGKVGQQVAHGRGFSHSINQSTHQPTTDFINQSFSLLTFIFRLNSSRQNSWMKMQCWNLLELYLARNQNMKFKLKLNWKRCVKFW